MKTEKNNEKNLLLTFLDENFSNKKEYFEYVKYSLDHKVYYFGEHFKQPYGKQLFFKEKVYNFILCFVSNKFVLLKSFFNKKNKKINILSTAYFNLESKNINKTIFISRPPWAYSKRLNDIYDYKLYRQCEYIKRELNYGDFKTLISDEFIQRIQKLEKNFKSFVIQNNIKAIFLAHDMGFFEKLSIKVFKDLGLPSFVFVHGLQFYHNIYDFNRASYLVVWGKLSKDDFVKNGFKSSKILISGHPKYNFDEIKTLKFEFENILILTKCLPGSPPSDQVILSDRGDCIFYLYTIQKVLQSFGVTNVRLRPHPSENFNWYKKYIDTEFFKPDNEDLQGSLKKSTLVIGPTSTVFVESLLNGINYVIYEPCKEDKIGLDGYKIFAMYNGDNPLVPVATNQLELLQILSERRAVNSSILKEIIQPNYDFSEIINLVFKNQI